MDSKTQLDARSLLLQRARDLSLPRHASALLLSAHAYLVRTEVDEELARFLHECCGEGVEV